MSLQLTEAKLKARKKSGSEFVVIPTVGRLKPHHQMDSSGLTIERLLTKVNVTEKFSQPHFPALTSKTTQARAYTLANSV
ncbi:MAG: hypothetical protein ACRD82_20320 [Blastocatellia bacterium]